MYNYFFILLLLLWSCDTTNGNSNTPDPDPVEVADTTKQPIDTTAIDPGSPVDTTATATVDYRYFFYIGTYTDGGSKGIYKATFDSDSGTISTPELVAIINNASFQSISKDRRLLFSVNESWSGVGSVTGYLIDTITGNLTKTESFSSLGNGPCYVSFDDNSLNVVTANYSSGNVTKIPVTANGKANGKSYTHQHTGKGPNTGRQDGPHAHCSVVDPTGKYIYSCDLGTDKIYVYTISGDSLALFKTIETAPGAGPRHLDFHPQLKSMAVVNELNANIVIYLPDADGCFSIENNSHSTLPNSFNGQNKCADIHYSNDGNFLYASNRGHNSIVCYSVNSASQKASLVGWQTENLKTTRNFAIDPSGKYLVAANQDGNNITVYEINKQTGELRYTGISRTISRPVCITFLTSAIK
jgi:6-phosphogluconolactonase